MKSNYLVSIIIPVYNAELYLKDCIQSIITQTYENIELILVNDGSTDSSGMICEEFKSKDLRIKVIHQSNSGPSISRNRGIELARGKYIQFVDSDDTIEPTMTKRLVESMVEEVDLILSGYKTVLLNEGNKKVSRIVIPKVQGILSNGEILGYFGDLFRDLLINSPCNKLYITELIKVNKIQFDENLKMGEDLLFNLDYLKICRNINFLNEPLYNYLLFNNTNSLTSSYNEDLFGNQQLLFQKVREFLIKNKSFCKKNKQSVEVFFTNSVVVCLSNLMHENSPLTSRAIKEQMYIIVNSKEVRGNLNYFKFGSVQKRLVGYLITNKSVNGIYYFIKTKSFLRNKIEPVFRVLKIVNNKAGSNYN